MLMNMTFAFLVEIFINVIDYEVLITIVLTDFPHKHPLVVYLKDQNKAKQT